MELQGGIPLIAFHQLGGLFFCTTSACNAQRTWSFGAGDGHTAKQERAALETALEPLHVTWLELEHGGRCVLASGETNAPIRADAALVTQEGQAVALTTADCLPVVITDKRWRIAALAHAGWRGLAAGVIHETLLALQEQGSRLEDCQAWIGPCIHAADYEVGAEVRDALILSPYIDVGHFVEVAAVDGVAHYLADLPAMATSELNAHGIRDVRCFPVSTRGSRELHSVRRDGQAAGRMATVVGIGRPRVID
jgi:YfiH family protein